MKKYLVLALVLLGLVAASPVVTQAATVSDLQAQIAQLMAQIQALTGRGATTSCQTLGRNLRVGDNDHDVSLLREILRKEGFDTTASRELLTFDEVVAAGVVGFQEKYAAEILTPNGLAHGTGYVGPATRAVVNRLECKTSPLPSAGPVISGVSGPTTLKVGEQGTWLVTASDPNNGTLSYSVVWGDEGSMNALRQSEAVSQTATFTHTYRSAGIYTPTFTVTSNAYKGGQNAKTSVSVLVGEKTESIFNLISRLGAVSTDGAQQVTYRVELSGNARRSAGDWTLQITCPAGVVAAGKGGFGCGETQKISSGEWDVWFTNSTTESQTIEAVAQLLSGKDGSVIATDQDAITIKPRTGDSAQSSIKVISPNGGERFETGKGIPFTWRWTGSHAPTEPTVYIVPANSDDELGGGVLKYLADSAYDSGRTTQRGVVTNAVCSVFPSGPCSPGLELDKPYRLKICEFPDNPRAYPTKPLCDKSDGTFTIIAPPVGTTNFEVSSSVVKSGEDVRFSWLRPAASVSPKLFFSCQTGVTAALSESAPSLCNHWLELDPRLSAQNIYVTNTGTSDAKVYVTFNYLERADGPGNSRAVEVTVKPRLTPSVTDPVDSHSAIKSINNTIATPVKVGTEYRGFERELGVFSLEINDSIKWWITSGALPPGLRLSNPYSHLVSIIGTPTTAGSFPFTVKVSNGQQAAEASFTLVVE